MAGGEAARTEQLGREVPLHLGEWEQGTPARVCGSGARAGAGGGLHVVEPELLLHVAGRHLPEGRLVVLHELEDGRQLFLLNSVEERGERGERCSRSRPRGTQSTPRGGDPGAWLLRFPESAENQSRTKPLSNRSWFALKNSTRSVWKVGFSVLGLTWRFGGPRDPSGSRGCSFPPGPAFDVAPRKRTCFSKWLESRCRDGLGTAFVHREEPKVEEKATWLGHRGAPGCVPGVLDPGTRVGVGFRCPEEGAPFPTLHKDA